MRTGGGGPNITGGGCLSSFGNNTGNAPLLVAARLPGARAALPENVPVPLTPHVAGAPSRASPVRALLAAAVLTAAAEASALAAAAAATAAAIEGAKSLGVLASGVSVAMEAAAKSTPSAPEATAEPGVAAIRHCYWSWLCSC